MDNITHSALSHASSANAPEKVPLSARPTSLIPVSATLNKNGVLVHFSGHTYNVKLATPLSPHQFTKAQAFLLNIVQQSALVSSTTQMQLLTLGQALYFPMPKAMLALANRNNVSERKLVKLGNKSEGYLLPNAKVSGSELQFNNGSRLTLPMLASLASGEYSVAVKTREQQLFLKLTPIQAKIPITLDGSHTNNEEPAPRPEALSHSKTNVNHQYRALFTQLESTPLPQEPESTPLTPKLPVDIADKNNKPEPKNFLTTALAKAGALPRASIKQSLPTTSLASEMFKRLPMLNPESLSSLSEPNRLQQALLSQNLLNIAPSNWLSAAPSHVNTLSLVCQLLLGRSAMESAIAPLSSELTNRLAALQTRLGLSPQILSILAATEAQKPLAELLNNLSLYQQQSGAVDGNNHWYFALPYSINHYQEQFEGHFEQSNDPQKSTNHWKLRLKFNLSSSPLLITAKASGVDRLDNALRITVDFASDNQNLLNKVNLLSPKLSSKIEQLGLSVVAINTQKQAVAATLLPGEHYLVKVKV